MRNRALAFGSADERLSQLEGEMASINTQLAQIAAFLQSLDQRVLNVDTRISSLDQRMSTFDARLSRVEQDVHTLRTRSDRAAPVGFERGSDPPAPVEIAAMLAWARAATRAQVAGADNLARGERRARG